MEMRPGYKRTEVGVIPEDWDVTSLGDLFSITAGGDLEPSRSTSVQDTHHPYPIYSNALSNKGLYGFSSYGHYKAESITVTARGTLGVANYRDHPFTAIGRVLVLKPSKLLDGRYFASVINERIDFAAESTGVPQLTAPQISKYRVPIPPIAEQRAIAAVLSDVDALITALDRLIAKKRAIKRGAMQQLLTARTRLPGFSGAWEVMPFEDVFVRMSSRDHQIQTSDYQADGLYPVVDQGTRLVTGYSDRDDKVFRCPDRGAIVFGDHTCIVKFVDFDFVVGADGTQILVAKPGQCTHFHAYQLQNRPIHPTGYNRHSKFLKERQYLAPFLREQRSIAAVLSDIDAEITALEARRDKTLALKKGMMQELLTGKTRLI